MARRRSDSGPRERREPTAPSYGRGAGAAGPKVGVGVFGSAFRTGDSRVVGGRHVKRKPARPRPTRRRISRAALLRWAAVGTVWALIFVLGTVAYYAWDLPDIDMATASDRKPSLTLLSDEGELLTSFGDIYGATVRVADLPPHLPQAVIAVEDRRFLDHFGVDLTGLVRAAYVNLVAGEVTQGGSTITQQLAKNLFLTPERTFGRKIREVLLALWLEYKFGKEEILSLYLNRVYLGAGAYGVDAAARRYFGKPAREVTLWQAAVLAGLLRAPSRLAPTRNPELAAERARLVLSLMAEQGFITEAQARHAAADTVRVADTAIGEGNGIRYFADWVADQVQAYLGAVDRDLLVRTTLDPRLQEAAHRSIRAALARESKTPLPEQAALVAMTPQGAVRAMVGGLDYGRSQFNRATQALRQPGSAFKLFVFLAALEAGIYADDRFVDAPVAIGDWRPGNYGERYYGEMTMREAVARSLNSVAVQAAQRVGPARIVETAERLGIDAALRPELSLALGTSEVTLLDLTGAYAALANRGQAAVPHGIVEIRGRDGEILYKRGGAGPGRAVAPDILAQINDMLNAVVEWGTGKAARLDRPAAGKTGTSQDFRDAWFIGFTADLVAGVWTGNDDNSPMKNVTGGGVPARIWHDFMTAAHAGLPKRPLYGIGEFRQEPPRREEPVAAAPAQPEERSFLPRSWFGGSRQATETKSSPVIRPESFEKFGQ